MKLRWLAVAIGLLLVAAFSVSTALQIASNHRASYADSKARWIRASIVPGMSRAVAYQMIKSEGLTAYNSAFVKGRPIPAPSPDPRNPLNGTGCEYDTSSGDWPYKNEPLPKQEGACTLNELFGPKTRPDADIELPGAFNIACSWLTEITIAFDESDRITTVNVGTPSPVCM